MSPYSRLTYTKLTMLTLVLPMLISATPAGTVIENIATYEDAYGSTKSNAVRMVVQEVCGASLTPPAEKRQARIGEQVTASFKLQNDGNKERSFPLSLATQGGTQGARLSIDRNNDGTIDQENATAVTLAIGETVTIVISMKAGDEGESKTILTTGCNQELSSTLRVSTKLSPPEVSKVVVGENPTLEAGATVKYAIQVRNPEDFVSQNFEVSDLLSDNLEFVSLEGATPTTEQTAEGFRISWSIQQLGPGQTAEFTLTTRVRKSVPDDTVIHNTALARGRGGDTISDDATIRVFTSHLLLRKSAQNANPEPGQQVVYQIEVTNPSNTEVKRVMVDDLPDPQLEIDIDSILVNGQPTTASSINGHILIDIGDMPAGSSKLITYRGRTPLIGGERKNMAVAYGMGNGNEVSATIMSNSSDTTIKPRVHLGSAVKDVAGRVYIDQDRNGRFNAQIDQPVEGARVMLAGGRSSITDSSGLYSFKDVYGTAQAVMLDPRSIPWIQEAVPGRPRMGEAHTFQAIALNIADFPLSPMLNSTSSTVGLGDVRVTFTRQNKNDLGIMLKNPTNDMRCISIPEYQFNLQAPAGKTAMRVVSSRTVNLPDVRQSECNKPSSPNSISLPMTAANKESISNIDDSRTTPVVISFDSVKRVTFSTPGIVDLQRGLKVITQAQNPMEIGITFDNQSSEGRCLLLPAIGMRLEVDSGTAISKTLDMNSSAQLEIIQEACQNPLNQTRPATIAAPGSRALRLSTPNIVELGEGLRVISKAENNTQTAITLDNQTPVKRCMILPQADMLIKVEPYTAITKTLDISPESSILFFQEVCEGNSAGRAGTLESIEGKVLSQMNLNDISINTIAEGKSQVNITFENNGSTRRCVAIPEVNMILQLEPRIVVSKTLDIKPDSNITITEEPCRHN